jgi:hypothetical protein
MRCHKGWYVGYFENKEHWVVPWVLLLFLVPLANTIMQILLFAVPPKEK